MKTLVASADLSRQRPGTSGHRGNPFYLFRFLVAMYLLLAAIDVPLQYARELPSGGFPWGIVLHESAMSAACLLTLWAPASGAALGLGSLVWSVIDQPYGEEFYLLLLVPFMLVTFRTRRQALALTAAYAIVIPGWLLRGRASTFLFFEALLLAGVGVGVVARTLLASSRRSGEEVRRLERRNARIRSAERLTLATDLRDFVTSGLTASSALLAEHLGDLEPASLRQVLAAVAATCRSTLDDLRALVCALRAGPCDDPTAQSGSSTRTNRRLPFRAIDALRAHHAAGLRTLASLPFLVPSIQRLRAETVAWAVHEQVSTRALADILSMLAISLWCWRPRAGVVCGIAALSLSLFAGGSLGAELWPLGLGIVLVASNPRQRTAVWGGAFLAGYAIARISTGPDPRTTAFILLTTAIPAFALGLTARHFATVRTRNRARTAQLDSEAAHIREDERTALARELHDVVAHQLSIISMQVMGHGASEDPLELRQVASRVETATRSAQADLRLLLDVMAEDLPDATDGAPPGPSQEWTSPTATARALTHALQLQGFRVESRIAGEADDLSPTTRKTLTRLLQETTTNMLRYTPPGSLCCLSITINNRGANLTAASPLGQQVSRSNLSLGWGLRGLAERIDLTGGTLSAGPHGSQWIVTATLPHRVAGER